MLMRKICRKPWAASRHNSCAARPSYRVSAPRVSTTICVRTAPARSLRRVYRAGAHWRPHSRKHRTRAPDDSPRPASALNPVQYRYDYGNLRGPLRSPGGPRRLGTPARPANRVLLQLSRPAAGALRINSDRRAACASAIAGHARGPEAEPRECEHRFADVNGRCHGRALDGGHGYHRTARGVRILQSPRPRSLNAAKRCDVPAPSARHHLRG
jgi:hypothetical protein